MVSFATVKTYDELVEISRIALENERQEKTIGEIFVTNIGFAMGH